MCDFTRRKTEFDTQQLPVAVAPVYHLYVRISHRLLSSIALSHFVSMCQLLSKIYVIKRKLIFLFSLHQHQYIISAFTINSTGLKEKFHGQQQEDLSFQYANGGPLKDSQIHFKWQGKPNQKFDCQHHLLKLFYL